MNELTRILMNAARAYNAQRNKIATATRTFPVPANRRAAPLLKIAQFGTDICGAGVYATGQGAEHLIMYVLNGAHLKDSNGFVPNKAAGLQLAEGFATTADARASALAEKADGWDKVETDAQAEQEKQSDLETRACTNEDCGWEGKTDRMCGSVGPLCERCGDTTEAQVDAINGPSETCDEGWAEDGSTADDSPSNELPKIWYTAQQQKLASAELETAVPNGTPSALKLRPYQQATADAVKARIAEGDKLVLDIPATASRTVGTAPMGVVPATNAKVKIEHGRETKRRKARRAGNKKPRGMNAQASNLLSKLLGH